MQWDELNKKIGEIAKQKGISKAALLREIGIPHTSPWYSRREAAIKKVLEYLNLDSTEDDAMKGNEINMEFIRFLDKKEAKEINWREWFQHAEKHKELHQNISASQDIANIGIKTDRDYIAIVFTADWHLGSISTDYKSLMENIDYLLNTDGLYVVTVGDLTDNFIRFHSVAPVLSQIFSPREQARILASMVNEFTDKGKWLAACWGNHDIERDEKTIGFSIIKEMLSEKLVYFNGKGIISLKFNDGPEYRIVLTHNAKGNSIYNPTHSNIRMFREFFPGDVIVTGHRHFPAFQYFSQYEIAKELGYDIGGDCWFIQTGTFKIDDGYSKRCWRKGIKGMPTLILKTEEKELTVVKSPEFAKYFVNQKRGKK